MNPKERRIVAIHESGHALVGWLLETTDALLKVTIVPRTNHALGFASYLPSDQKLYNTQEVNKLIIEKKLNVFCKLLYNFSAF